MGRKLKGKSTSKGLKQALQKHLAAEKQNKAAKKKQHNIIKSKQQKSQKLIKHQEYQRQQTAKFIPFGEDETLLLVGEGDFSFARSIIEQEYIKPENLIATSYDASVNELKLKYPNCFEDNYNFLIEAGVKVFFQINAMNLIKTFKLSKHTPWRKQLGKNWALKYLNNIMFNFPHTGKGIKDQDKNIRDHQELVFGYFDSANQLFKLINNYVKIKRDGYSQGYTIQNENETDKISENGIGRIILSTFNGEPYDSWQIKILAKKNNLVLDKSCKFEWSNYPEYHHKRTNSEQDTTKPAMERDARTYIFREFEKRKAKKGSKADAGRDEEDSD